MGFRFWDRFSFNGAGESKTDSKLPKIDWRTWISGDRTKLAWPFLKAALFLVGALIAGWIADQHSGDRAIQSWLEAHPLPEGVLISSLEGFGFEAVQSDLDLVHRVSKTLPLSLDSLGDLWIEDSKSWIVWMPKNSEIPRVFRRRGSKWNHGWGKVDPVWQSLGQGWVAFERLLSILSALRAPMPSDLLKTKKTTSQWRDPREVRY